MLKKRFEKTEILDEEFLEKLDEEIQKKYPYNAKSNDNTNNIDSSNIEVLEDTAELYVNSFFKDIEKLKEEDKKVVTNYRSLTVDAFHNINFILFL